ncbi:MAG: InlB B-repeat-containing protein, partial [bacterium]|nr:InlB B-repeat-containing protein [bacterium]
MWKKKQVVSLMLGMSMTMSNVLPALPANAAQDVPLNGQTAEGMMENGDEGEELQTASASNASRATASNALRVEDEKSTSTHIATFVGEIPQVEDVEWEEGVSEEDFSEAYSTVTVKSTEGISYTVEVIPKNLLYFIDNGAGDTTPPFEAMAALSDTLKNDKADGKWDESAGWGYTYSSTIGTKGNMDAANKTDTGIYGDNKANTPLEYHFALEAGTYTITSEHVDWWAPKDRPMSMTLRYGDTVLDVGSINGTGTINYTFTLTEAQTVIYSINNTAGQAALVSWIAVAEADPSEMVTVSFDTQGGSEIADMAVMPGIKLTAPSNPTKEGFAFKGWYQDAECTKSWNFSKDTVPEEGLTLFAKWGEAEALEDQGLVTARTGASLQNDFGDGKMLVVSESWISGGNSPANGGGVIENAANYFKTSEFTWYTDFSFNGSHDNTSALLLGNSENHFRLIPRKSDESAVLRVKAGEKETDIALDTQLDTKTWHSVAVLYEEDDTQGYVTLVADGETMTESAALGFKLSEQEDLLAGFGITYGTGFMRDGKYDNIVVESTKTDVETAAAETVERAKYKNSQKQDVTRIVIDGSEVEEAAKNMNGLTFKGFGVLDCNSTNSLLLDYKAQNPEKYWEMLELLFGGENPIMQHVKIEMGNDKNNSTGSQACTMRTADEYPDVSRVTGFQLAADAKKINPDVKVSLLYWETPGWVGSNWNNLYKWIKNTILAANREYGYMVDMVSPGKNESADDVNYLKQFHNWLINDTEGMISKDSSVAGFREGEAEQLHEVQIIMSDEVGVPSAAGSQMTGDAALREAVDIVGYHYNTNDDSAGSFKRLAEEFDKEIWNSEAQATFGSTADRPNNNMVDGGDPGTGIGGNGSPLEMANTIIKGFVNSRRTHFIYQPTFGAFYEGTQYNYKDVMAARDPWSGYVNYDGALNIMEHFSKFAVTGWEYDTPDENVVWRALPGASMSEATGTNPVNGRNGGQMYMTLAAPDKSDFSVIISNDSAKTKNYRISPKDLNLPEGAELEVWETREADEGDIYNANYMKCVEHLTANPDGSYDLTVKPWSIVTVTSLDMDAKEEELAFPTATEDGRYVLDTDESGKKQDTTDNYLYADDFDYENMPNVTSYENGEIVESDESFIESRGGEDGFYPLYTQDTNGTFEVVMDESGNGVLKMNGQTGGGRWNGGEPATILGDYRWMNYKVSVDFNLNSTSESLLLGARQRGAAGGGDNKVSMSAYNIALNRNGEWVLRRYSSEIAKGTVKVKNAEACNVALKVAGDTVTAYIEGNEIYSYKDSNPQLEGRIMLGVGLPGAAWTAGEFDNLKVETVPGYTPYFTMVHDNLHMKEWDGDKAGEQTLVYEGSWSHVNQKGSNYSQRSYSETSSVGASVSYTFDGTGFALIGPNGGSAKVNVDVDGERMYTDMATIKTESHQPYLVIRGLEDGEHTVKVTLASGSFGVDSIAYLSKNETASSHLTLDALQTVMNTMENLNEDDYDPDSWKDYQEALTAASSSRWTLEVVNSILADPIGYGVDQEVINEITDSYQALLDKLLKKDAPVEILSQDQIPKMAAISVGEGIEDLGDTLPKTVKVRNADGTENDAAEITWKLSSDTRTAYSTITAVGTVTGGKNLTASVQIEVVPANLLYFIDTGTTDNSVYDVYKTLAPELKNETNDKKAEGTDSWGRKGDYSTRGTSNAMDKGDTGVWNDGGDIVYQLPLEAGVYTLSAGFKQWWGSGENRELNQSISYTLADGSTKTVSGDKVSVSGSTVTSATSFVLSEDTVVTYTVSKAGNKAPVLSWLG